jgi:spermidine synthase
MRRTRPSSVPITLSEEAGIRYLHFGSRWVQGAMHLGRPTDLVLEYVRQMMGWMLFLDPPGSILQLGLGAGSLTRFTLAHCPGSRVTAVDCSQEVIDTARDWFALPADEPRLRVVRSDAQAFVERRDAVGAYGVIQVDLYDMHAHGPAIDSLRFYRACRQALAQPGICVVNLFGRHDSFAPNLRRIERAFEGRVLALPPIAAGNRVVFAFSGPPLAVAWDQLDARARALQRLHRLIARPWVRALRELSGDAVCAV